MRTRARHLGVTTDLPDQPIVLRSLLFLAVFWFFWISLTPFPDLSDPKLAEPDFEGNTLNQAAAILLTAACVLYALPGDLRRWLVVVTIPFMALFAWLFLTAAASPMPAVAVKKLVLALFIVINAATLLLLPVSKRHFAALLAIGIAVTLIASFYGIALVPERAIHQPTEIVEPQLAGDWRGVFKHKNEAGTATTLIGIAAILIWRTLSPTLGAALLLGGLVLMFFSGSKSAFGLLVASLAAAWLVLRLKTPAIKYLIAIGLVLVPGLLTVGSAFLPPIYNGLAALGIDPTYTARTDIWRIAVSATMDRPILGNGFQVFWGTADVTTASDQLGSWAVKATSAHNAYLEMMVWAGIPGLALGLLWLLIQPIGDLVRAQSNGADPALTAFYTQIWAYMILSGTLESIFFVGGGPVWITLLVGLFGLRYQAHAVMSRPTPGTATAPLPTSFAHPTDATQTNKLGASRRRYGGTG